MVSSSFVGACSFLILALALSVDSVLSGPHLWFGIVRFTVFLSHVTFHSTFSILKIDLQ